jgi:ferredoxin
VKEPNPIQSDRRDARHLDRLGNWLGGCLFCGISDPVVLIPKSVKWLEQRVPRTVLEDHHLYGQNHDPNCVVPLCRNCHYKVTAGYYNAGINMKFEPNAFSRALTMLSAAALFFNSYSVSLFQIVELLEKERKHNGNQEGN